jgi:hypothetical protein
MDRSTTTKLALFVAGLAAVFGLAFGVGRLVGPIDSGADLAPHGAGMTEDG